MVHCDFADKQAILSRLDLFKVDSKEALLLTGEANPERAARVVHALGAKLVLLTHQAGVCDCDGRETYSAAFGNYPLEGRAGGGDTCTASLLVARGRNLNFQQAATFAADITTRKMQYRGPFRG
jgi:sugar/nucleoside kinase (ribokinase family)